MQVFLSPFIEISDRRLVKPRIFIHYIYAFPYGDTSNTLFINSVETIDKIPYDDQDGASGLTISVRTTGEDVHDKQEWKH